MVKILTIQTSLGEAELNLGLAGVQVIHGLNVWDGVDQFTKHAPDVVIVGGREPEEVLKTIITFREEQLPEARFIALVEGTPEVVEVFKRQAAIYGVRQVATLPVGPEKIAEMIEELVGIPGREFRANLGNLPAYSKMPLVFRPFAAE